MRKWKRSLRRVERGLGKGMEGLEGRVMMSAGPIGYVDSWARDQVCGWAFDGDAGTGAIRVRVDVDGQVASMVMADGERPDLVGYGPVGSAMHGFWVGMPVMSSVAHEVAVWAEDVPSGGWVRLGGGTIGPGPRGYIDHADEEVIYGWACDDDIAPTSTMVRVDVDGVQGTPIWATLAREDLVGPVGSANHGFMMEMPRLLGLEHLVSVWVKDYPSEAWVRLGSLTVVPRTMGWVDHAGRESVVGWAYDRDVGGNAVTVRVDIDGALGAGFLANENRQDLEAYGWVGTPDHGFTFLMPTLSVGAHDVVVWVQGSGGWVDIWSGVV